MLQWRVYNVISNKEARRRRWRRLVFFSLFTLCDFFLASVPVPSHFLFPRLFLFGPLLRAFLLFCHLCFDGFRFLAALLLRPPAATADRIRLFLVSSLLRQGRSWMSLCSCLVRRSVCFLVFFLRFLFSLCFITFSFFSFSSSFFPSVFFRRLHHAV